MKKRLISLFCVCLLGVTSLFGGCGKEIIKDIDKNKTQIYLSLAIGGTGSKWLDDLVEEYNKTQTKYEFVVAYEKINTEGVRKNIESGIVDATTPSVYYTLMVDMQELIHKGMLEDLSDLCAREVDGPGNGTLKDKIGSSPDYYEEVWQRVASKNGEGIYMLPYADSYAGLIFDYGTFLEKGFLQYAEVNQATKTALTEQKIAFKEEGGKLICDGYTGDDIYFNYKNGDAILTAGKDGKYGSYDDGQPITIEEWEAMLDKIADAGCAPFLWSGMYEQYVDMVQEGVMAQYAGLDEYNTYHTYEGNVRIDGKETEITPDTGYLVYGMDAYGKSLHFINDYLNNPKYYSPKVKESLSHTDAQGLFVLAYKNKKNPPMMLVDGEWWENEAKAILTGKLITQDGMGYGKRDYRFMLYPNMPGQKGVDGNGHGTILAVQNSGAIVVPKCEDKEKLAVIKDFLAFSLTDEALRNFTVETSIANAYDYALTSEDLAKMTPFARNVFQIYHDSENVGFARGMALYAANPMRFATGAGFFRNKVIFAGEGSSGKVQNAYFFAVMRTEGVTVDSMIECAKYFYSHEGFDDGMSYTTWKDLIGQCRKAGFFS